MTGEYRISGLNKKSRTGIYATIRMDNEDWFHSDFDESVFPIERQYALFDYFKNGDDNVWKDNKKFRAVVKFDRLNSSGVPVNPIIIEIKNLN